ncbi:hypothetical protein A2U01_0047494, partial [Trifolium medium]|nr:hypothetical protein [Trifolium medium]
VQDKSSHDTRLAARVSGKNFKSKSAGSHKKISGNFNELLEGNNMGNFLVSKMHNNNTNKGMTGGQQFKKGQGRDFDVEKQLDNNDDGPQMNSTMGQNIVINPNEPRPPDMLHAPHSSSSIPVSLPGKKTMDNEVYIDANGHGIVELSDSEMEIVNETQKLGQ